MKGKTISAQAMAKREDYLEFAAFAERCGFIAQMPEDNESSNGIPFIVKALQSGQSYRYHLYLVAGVDLTSDKFEVLEMGVPYSFLSNNGDGQNPHPHSALRMMRRLLKRMPTTGLADDRLAELMILVSERHYNATDFLSDYEALFKHETQKNFWDYAVELLKLKELTDAQRIQLARQPVPLDVLKSGIVEGIPYSLLSEMASLPYNLR